MIDIPALRAELWAEGQRVNYTDLAVFDPANDPCGVYTKTRIVMAEWAAWVWRNMGELHGLHIRRMHYWLVSSDVQKLNGLLSKIKIDVDIGTEPPCSELVVGGGGWLFDSKRRYLDQLAWYRSGGI